NRSLQTCLWCYVGNGEEHPQIRNDKTGRSQPFTLTSYDLCHDTPASLPARTFDIVMSSGDLQHMPDEDVPWILAELFSLAKSLVFVHIFTAASPSAMAAHPAWQSCERRFEWWISYFASISNRYPHIRWKFVFG